MSLLSTDRRGSALGAAGRGAGRYRRSWMDVLDGGGAWAAHFQHRQAGAPTLPWPSRGLAVHTRHDSSVFAVTPPAGGMGFPPRGMWAMPLVRSWPPGWAAAYVEEAVVRVRAAVRPGLHLLGGLHANQQRGRLYNDGGKRRYHAQLSLPRGSRPWSHAGIPPEDLVGVLAEAVLAARYLRGGSWPFTLDFEAYGASGERGSVTVSMPPHLYMWNTGPTPCGYVVRSLWHFLGRGLSYQAQSCRWRGLLPFCHGRTGQYGVGSHVVCGLVAL